MKKLWTDSDDIMWRDRLQPKIKQLDADGNPDYN